MLVAGEDHAGYDALVRGLDDAAFDLVTARDQSALLEAVQGGSAGAPGGWPDAIIVDSAILDDRHALGCLKDDPHTRHIPVLLLLDDCAASVAPPADEWCADEIMLQSTAPAEIVSRLRLLLRLREMSLGLQRANEQRSDLARTLLTLSDLSGSLTACDELDHVLDHVLAGTTDITGAQRAAILLADREQRYLTVVASVGRTAGSLSGLGIFPAAAEQSCEGRRIGIDAGIAGRVFASGVPEIAGQQESAPDAAECFPFERDRGCAYLPLVATGFHNTSGSIGVLCLGRRWDGVPHAQVDLESYEVLASFAAAAIAGIMTRTWRDQARDSIVLALVGLTEQRDNETGRHLERVATFCVILAEELRQHPTGREIDETFIRELRRTAPLHDIGKVGIPDRILQKPGRLAADEVEIMRTHTVIGAETIRSVRERYPDSSFVKMAEDIARHHHEWYSGAGYPDGLSGSGIPLAARIVTLADVYDALTSRRVYKPPMPHEAAMDIVCNLSGQQFDPLVIGAFVKHHERFRNIAAALNDESEPVPEEASCTSVDESK
ncbi:MAG: HD domain-containing protein [Planctomycetes bacterium]|nr:HD domain-containing protein [Planctomycetota bacterium]